MCTWWTSPPPTWTSGNGSKLRRCATIEVVLDSLLQRDRQHAGWPALPASPTLCPRDASAQSYSGQ